MTGDFADIESSCQCQPIQSFDILQPFFESEVFGVNPSVDESVKNIGIIGTG
jgi:hypothetical protein